MIIIFLISLCLAQETTTVEPETTTLFPISQFAIINGMWDFDNGNGQLSISENDARTGVNIFIFTAGSLTGLVQDASVTFGATSVTITGTNSLSNKSWSLVCNSSGSSGSFTENGSPVTITKSKILKAYCG